ncbi:YqgE/AlgH family protein [Benzoatithermus flavus]|uniref:YqgE/AlgH family protein n=1 Tax=Benzoatithermus flavus TaxID=3108223 RepID=UPI003AAB7F7C
MARWIGCLLVLLVNGAQAAAPPADRDEPAASLAGRLLVADPGLADPNFDHTVVLILRDGSEGTLGLVLNRPYGKMPTAELLRRLGLDGKGVTGETELFYGGPVQPEIGMVVHSPDYEGPHTLRIAPGLAVTGDPEVLADLAAGKGPRQAIPVLGYAGWAPGQLAGEIAAGAWFSIPADPTLVFAPDAGSMWKRAMARRGIEL